MVKRKNICFKFLIISLIVIFILMTFLGAVSLLILYQNGSFIRFNKEKLTYETNYNRLKILDKDGNIIEGKTKKNFVDIDSLSMETIFAFISTEDKKFFKHNGIDFKRIVGAFFNNLKSGKIAEGASTITQQLAKNIFLSSEKSIKRKINEIILAKKIEKNFTKNEILKIYLDTIYFGNGAYGLQNAANTFFGVDASELSLSQAAGLAGLLKAPNSYSPIYNRDKFEKRKNLVLKIMYDDGIISHSDYLSALDEKLEVRKKDHNDYSQDYYDMVICQACDVLGIYKNDLLSKNYVIETYCDLDAQKSLVSAVDHNEILTEKGNKTNK